MRNIAGNMLVAVGALLTVGGAVALFNLVWIDHPEATDRLLLTDHTRVYLGSHIAMIAGSLTGVIGLSVRKS